MITKDHEFMGKSIGEITSGSDVSILLVLRDEMSLLPTENIVLKKGDIVVLRSEALKK